MIGWSEIPRKIETAIGERDFTKDQLFTYLDSQTETQSKTYHFDNYSVQQDDMTFVFGSSQRCWWMETFFIEIPDGEFVFHEQTIDCYGLKYTTPIEEAYYIIKNKFGEVNFYDTSNFEDSILFGVDDLTARYISNSISSVGGTLGLSTLIAWMDRERSPKRIDLDLAKRIAELVNF